MPCSCQISTKADLLYHQLCAGIPEANEVYEIIVEEKKKKKPNFCFYVYSATHSEVSLESFVMKLCAFLCQNIKHPKTLFGIVFK